MRFSQAEQLALPCWFERIIPGDLHPDGRRYLPLIVFRLERPAASGITRLGVVDRHHRANPEYVGMQGVARLVFLLSILRVLSAPQAGLFELTEHDEAWVSTMPDAYGQVLAVPSWETQREHLPYESLYTECILDIGSGVIGVRTSTTAKNLHATIGIEQIVPGTWLHAGRSRIDLLSFTP